MARDDDDAVSEERLSKRRKDREEDEGDRPRRKRDEEDDDDRPRKKRDDDRDAGTDRGGKPMPLRLVVAIAATLAWGFFTMYLGCGNSSNAILQEIQYQKIRAKEEELIRKQEKDMEEIWRKQEEDAKRFNFKFERPKKMERPRSDSRGLFYCIAAAKVFLLFTSVLFVAAGIVLLMRKGFGKYIALAAPVLMILVEFFAFAICLYMSDWTFLAQYNVEFFVNIFFCLVVGGAVAFLLLNKEVSKALT